MFTFWSHTVSRADALCSYRQFHKRTDINPLKLEIVAQIETYSVNWRCNKMRKYLNIWSDSLHSVRISGTMWKGTLLWYAYQFWISLNKFPMFGIVQIVFRETCMVNVWHCHSIYGTAHSPWGVKYVQYSLHKIVMSLYGLFEKYAMYVAILICLETLKFPVSYYFGWFPLEDKYYLLVRCSEACCSRHQFVSYW